MHSIRMHPVGVVSVLLRVSSPRFHYASAQRACGARVFVSRSGCEIPFTSIIFATVSVWNIHDASTQTLPLCVATLVHFVHEEIPLSTALAVTRVSTGNAVSSIRFFVSLLCFAVSMHNPFCWRQAISHAHEPTKKLLSATDMGCHACVRESESNGAVRKTSSTFAVDEISDVDSAWALSELVRHAFS